MTEYTQKIKEWSTERNLDFGKPETQMLKLVEEVGELAEGFVKNDQDLVIDSIGDIYVVLVILCQRLCIDIKDCVGIAYGEIKDRKGKLVNGAFIKEEDLK